jgi:hypothetical protein
MSVSFSVQNKISPDTYEDLGIFVFPIAPVVGDIVAIQGITYIVQNRLIYADDSNGWGQNSELIVIR